MSYDDSVTRAWKMTPNPEASGSGPQTWLAAAQATGARADKRLPPIWRYDAFENRTSEIYGGSSTGNAPIPGSTSATYNANNQVQSASPGPVPNYDGAGNITYDGNNQYLYDAEGRICAVQSLLSGSAMTGYLYDAEGTRIAKGNITSFSCDTTLNANGQPNNGFIMTTSYILGPGNEQLTELAWSGGVPQWAHTKVWGAGQLMATNSANPDPSQTATAILNFHLTDWLGTRRVLTDAVGNPVESCASLPYGNGETCTPTPTEHLFTGKERDTESGNDYFGARYYASTMGRFLSPDPSGLLAQKPENPQSWNLYAYALNNPLINIDPTGLDCVYANDAGDGVESIDHNSNAGECGDNGGSWAPGYVNENWAYFNNNTNMFQVASLNNGKVDYTTFGAGEQTLWNGDESSCIAGCSSFASTSAIWLQSMIVGKGGFFGMMQFMADRAAPIHGMLFPGALGQAGEQMLSGPLDFWNNHWAGPSGMGAPGGRGDWAAMVHDYNYDANGITIGAYFNPTISPATARALIQSNNNLIRNAGGFQGAKMGLFFGAVNAFQWAAHVF